MSMTADKADQVIAAIDQAVSGLRAAVDLLREEGITDEGTLYADAHRAMRILAGRDPL